MKTFSPELLAAVRLIAKEHSYALEIINIDRVTLPAELLKAALDSEKKKGPSPEDLRNLWNDMRDPRLPECIKLNSRRQRSAAARLKEFPDKKNWEAFIEVINKNKWLTGVEPSRDYPNWKADFDWFVKPTSIIKFMEGGYREAAKFKTARDKYGDDLDARSIRRAEYHEEGQP